MIGMAAGVAAITAMLLVAVSTFVAAVVQYFAKRPSSLLKSEDVVQYKIEVTDAEGQKTLLTVTRDKFLSKEEVDALTTSLTNVIYDKKFKTDTNSSTSST